MDENPFVRILVWGAVACILILAIAHRAHSATERPAMIAHIGENSYAIYEDACTNANLLVVVKRFEDEVMPAPMRGQFSWQQGDALYKGKHYAVCWFLAPNGVVYFVYEDGDAGRIDFRSFQPNAALRKKAGIDKPKPKPQSETAIPPWLDRNRLWQA